MTDHDRLFKELLTTFFTDFLELFVPELAREVIADSIELLDKEVISDLRQGERRVVDLLARLRTRGPLAGASGASFVFVHVENESTARSGLPKRLYEYFTRLVARHGEAVYPIAVLSYDQPARPRENTYRIRLPGLDVLRFRFRVIQLNRLSWRAFLSRPNPVAAALMAKMRIAPGDRPRVKAACLRMLAGLSLDAARERLVSYFVDSYLRLDETEARLFLVEVGRSEPLERARVMEMVTSWMEEGILKGREERGATLTLRLLARKVGPITEPLLTQVQGLAAADLEDLAEALLDFASQDDLVRWLAARR